MFCFETENKIHFVKRKEIIMESNRDKWGSNLGFIMAAVGSAVGLGNIWGFPYKMGTNGGFAFLILYLILAVLVGFVVMLGELALGRKSGLGVVGTYQKLSKKYKWIGWLGALSPFLIMTFYSVLGGYCIKYIVLNFGDLINAGFGSGALDGNGVFTELLINQFESVMYTVIFMILTCIIVVGGVSGGIEKFSKVAMPALFVSLVIVIIRSVTLPGAAEGLKFMFAPNFAPLEKDFFGVLGTAGGQMFFSLSLGMGAMITYGSYLDKKEDLEKNAAIIIFSDTLIAVMAGLAVLPAAFALGGADAAISGPKLLFVTLQNVFDAMGSLGPLFGIIFYLLVFIAAITSSISLVEALTALFLDKAEEKGKEGNRAKIATLVSLAITALAVIVALDGLGSNGLPQPLGFCWLDFMDLWSEGIMMPVGAMLMCMFIGYEYTIDKFAEEVEAEGNKFRTRKMFTVCCKFIAIVALIFILYGQLQTFGIF